MSNRVEKGIFNRTREVLAERGFEFTPEELRQDEEMMEVLDSMSSPDRQSKLKKMALILNEKVKTGEINSLESFHLELEKILEMPITDQEARAFIDVFRIFTDISWFE